MHKQNVIKYIDRGVIYEVRKRFLYFILCSELIFGRILVVKD